MRQPKPAEHGPAATTRAQVAALAAQHGVVYVRTGWDAYAEVVTALAGDVVQSDATDDLLVALARAKVITPTELLQQLAAHHRELAAERGEAMANASESHLHGAERSD